MGFRTYYEMKREDGKRKIIEYVNQFCENNGEIETKVKSENRMD